MAVRGFYHNRFFSYCRVPVSNPLHQASRNPGEWHSLRLSDVYGADGQPVIRVWSQVCAASLRDAKTVLLQVIAGVQGALSSTAPRYRNPKDRKKKQPPIIGKRKRARPSHSRSLAATIDDFSLHRNKLRGARSSLSALKSFDRMTFSRLMCRSRGEWAAAGRGADGRQGPTADRAARWAILGAVLWSLATIRFAKVPHVRASGRCKHLTDAGRGPARSGCSPSGGSSRRLRNGQP